MSQNTGHKGFPVSIITTHEQPHQDEIYGIWLLQKFGEFRYPGISKAEIATTLNGNREPAEGELMIGIGGGRFDEHPDGAGGTRKEKECAATLVAVDLGIDKMPEIAPLLEYVRYNDLNGADHLMELGNLVKSLNRFGKCLEETLEICFCIFDAKYKEQECFLSAQADLDKAEALPVQWGNKEMLVLFAETDNPQFSSYVRSRYAAASLLNGNLLMIIQRNSTGYVQIFANKGVRFPLDGLAKDLRLAELGKTMDDISKADLEDLLCEKSQLCPKWYLQLKAGFLLNGSLSLREQEPTRLSLEEIQEVVMSLF